MLEEFNILNALVTIAFGALAGGLTNAVAIWMLFHPYEPWGPRWIRFHGAIPKNKPRLAKTIGRTVGERLLTAKDLTQQLSNPGVREAFDATVRGFVAKLLETRRESLRAELPPALLAEVDAALTGIAPRVADRLVAYADTEAFRDSVVEFRQRLVDEIGDRPVGGFFTVARREAIRTRVDGWVAEAVMNPGLENAIAHWLDRQIVRFAADQTPLLERLPPALVAAVEKEMAGYLPVALDRIADALSDPNARAGIQKSMHQLFEGFVKNLMIHERIVAKLVVTEKTINRLLDNVERDGVEQVSRLLEEPEVRSQVARSVNDAVVKFLRRPLSEHISALGEERMEGIKNTVAGHIVLAVRDDATRQYAIEKIDHALASAEDRTWSDLLRFLPPEDAATWVSSALASPTVRDWIADGTSAAVRALLDRPIGLPADYLPPHALDRISAALTPALWRWIEDQIPTLVEKIDIQQMVEEKVLGFSLQRIEEIVRNTTQRELDLIVRLGYALGAIVGALAYAVSTALP